MKCSYCNAKNAPVHCSACQHHCYCNKLCQTKNWPYHKLLCYPPNGSALDVVAKNMKRTGAQISTAIPGIPHKATPATPELVTKVLSVVQKMSNILVMPRIFDSFITMLVAHKWDISGGYQLYAGIPRTSTNSDIHIYRKKPPSDHVTYECIRNIIELSQEDCVCVNVSIGDTEYEVPSGKGGGQYFGTAVMKHALYPSNIAQILPQCVHTWSEEHKDVISFLVSVMKRDKYDKQFTMLVICTECGGKGRVPSDYTGILHFAIE